jgi:hypothetical protein
MRYAAPDDLLLLVTLQRRRNWSFELGSLNERSPRRGSHRGDGLRRRRRHCKTDMISNLTSDWAGAEKSTVTQVQFREFRPNTNICGIHRRLEGAARLLLDDGYKSRRRAIVAITDDQGAGTSSATVHNTVRDLWMADVFVLA